MKAQLLNYSLGVVIILVALAFMPMSQADTNVILHALVFLSSGVFLSTFLRARKPSLFIAVPFLALLGLLFLR